MKFFESDQLAQYGFYIHAVYEANENGLINVHTHGLAAEGLEDLQVVLPIEPNHAMGVIHSAVEVIRARGAVELGDCADVLEGLRVRLVAGIESGRFVIRIILPDPTGSLERDNMVSPYGDQYLGIESPEPN